MGTGFVESRIFDLCYHPCHVVRAGCAYLSRGLDVMRNTLYLAPTMKPNEERVSLPLYFPQFWATVTAQRNTTDIGGKITLDIVKVHGTSLVQN